MRVGRITSLLLVLVVCLGSQILFAQSTNTGVVAGVVTDPSGAFALQVGTSSVVAEVNAASTELQTINLAPTTYRPYYLVGGPVTGASNPQDALNGTSPPADILNLAVEHSNNPPNPFNGEIWGGFPAGPGYTPAVLNIRNQVEFNHSGTNDVYYASLCYSLDGGNHWYCIYDDISANRPLTLDQVTLPAGQDLTKVQVWGFDYAHVPQNPSSFARVDLYISQIWISEGN